MVDEVLGLTQSKFCE